MKAKVVTIEAGMARLAMIVVRQSLDEQQDRQRHQHRGDHQVEFHLLDRADDELSTGP